VLGAALVAPLLAPAAVHAAGAPIKSRNMDVSRAPAADAPRSEGDQKLYDGWPLYRSDRGQTAFNDAMATLAATDGEAPSPAAFKGCENLDCPLSLPKPDADGWLPQGRLWVAPDQYVLLVRSPRLAEGRSYRRRSRSDMRIFVYHEFHNSTRNTDTYDTISSHSGSVYVPLYLSKSGTDAKGRRYVVVVQVAPYDVVSRHASNMGSRGPGIEVAKNYTDELEPLQGIAGVLVASMVKQVAPQLRVVNHRGIEGKPMLKLYEERVARLSERDGEAPRKLPFQTASAERLSVASVDLGDLIRRPGVSPSIAVADRGFMPRKVKLPVPQRPAKLAAAAAAVPLTINDLLARSIASGRTRWLERTVSTDDDVPQLIGPVRLAIRPAASDVGAGRR